MKPYMFVAYCKLFERLFYMYMAYKVWKALLLIANYMPMSLGCN